MFRFWLWLFCGHKKRAGPRVLLKHTYDMSLKCHQTAQDCPGSIFFKGPYFSTSKKIMRQNEFKCVKMWHRFPYNIYVYVYMYNMYDTIVRYNGNTPFRKLTSGKGIPLAQGVHPALTRGNGHILLVKFRNLPNRYDLFEKVTKPFRRFSLFSVTKHRKIYILKVTLRSLEGLK